MTSFSTFNFDENNITEFLVTLKEFFPTYVQEPQRIKGIIDLFALDSTDLLTVIIEDEHIDRQYRDSYYSLFSQKYGNFNRNCMRLAFFKGMVTEADFHSDPLCIEKDLIGTVVLRPLNIGNIGCTLLNPCMLKVQGYVQTCQFKILLCGRKFSIRAFPFLSQDNETMTCAETALYNLIQYYSRKYSEYRLLMPSEILNILEAASHERVLPSRGIDEISMAKVLQAGHFHPRLYLFDDDNDGDEYIDDESSDSGPTNAIDEDKAPLSDVGCPSDCEALHQIEQTVKEIYQKVSSLEDTVQGIERKIECAEELFYAYVESGIPFILGLPHHAVICIGHGPVDFELKRHSLKNLVIWEELEGSQNIVYYLNTASLIEDFIFMDDNMPPYFRSTINSLTSRYYNSGSCNCAEDGESEGPAHAQTHCYIDDAIDRIKLTNNSMVVPLYKRIYLDASRARKIFEYNFLKSPEFLAKIREAYSDEDWGMTDTHPLVHRMYLASSNSYRDFRCRTAENDDIFKCYASSSFPRFIWVMEIGTLDTFAKQQARVEIILDATSSKNSDTWAILSIRYHKHLVFTPAIVTQMRKNHPDHLLSDLENPNLADMSRSDWDKCCETANSTLLTEIFESLYYIIQDFVPGTFCVYANSNLKEIS